MWNALRSDLTEFVTTVTGETAEALNQIDAGFPEGGKGGDDDNEQTSAAEEEALRRMALKETYTTPLLPEKEGKAKKEPEATSSSDDGKSDDDGGEENEEEDDDDDEVPEDVKEFVSSFSIESKTDEIALLLDVHPHSVKAHFETLVPTTVKYEDFWMRFFYRCDSDRIQSEWDAEEAAVKEARAQAVQQGLSTVRNILGGAVKAVSSTLAEGENTANQAQKAASGYFGSTGRPPFVMNTAVSEDDDFDGEDEEELGWDDDDDDDEDEDFEPPTDDGNEESVDTDEQIEFKDAVTEKLQDDLKQAFAERDSLHQTVELQQKEIASLKSSGISNDEVEKFKTQLFEKDSELAAMRASLLDSSRVDANDLPNPKIPLLEEEIKRLNTKVVEAETSAADALSKLENTQKQMGQKDEEIGKLKKAVAETSDKISGVSKEAEEWKKKATDLEKDSVNLKDALRAAEVNAKNAEETIEEAKALREEVEKLKAALSAAEVTEQELVSELKKAKESLHAKEESSKLEEEAKSVDSPDTVSTGIKIEPPGVEKLDEDVALEDGWDEDW